MLTVARVAAEQAQRAAAAADPAADLGRIVTAAAEGAREALRRTPEQLDVLARAGVVDAGGRGVCVLLDALATAVTGALPAVVDTSVPAHEVEAARPRSGLDVADPDAHGPTYEVMYLLDAGPTRSRRCAPPSSRWATRWSSSARSRPGTCTCTSTTWAPRSRRGSRPAVRTGSG